MSQESQSRRSTSSLYTQVDISPANQSSQAQTGTGDDGEQMELLRDILTSVDRNNELLEELLGVMTSQQKQRGQELQQWKQANSSLASSCRTAAESLSQVQVEFLHKMTEEINDTAEEMMDGEFVLNEFVDRFGPRLAHLNGVIQVLAQLGSIPNPTDPPQH